MDEFPHRYNVAASAAAAGSVELTSPGLEPLESAPPKEFGGPGDRWSPETLLAAAVADCFILSFRAVANASRFEWTALRCDVEAVLDRVDKVTRFIEVRQSVTLDLPAGSDEEKARRLLEKAEHICLVTNSLTAESRLEVSIRSAE